MVSPLFIGVCHKQLVNGDFIFYSVRRIDFQDLKKIPKNHKIKKPSRLVKALNYVLGNYLA